MADNYRLRLLSDGEITTIYEKCMYLISKKGVRVDHPEVLNIIGKEGAIVDSDTSIVCFPRDIVETAIETVPDTIHSGDKTIPDLSSSFITESHAGTVLYHDVGNDTLIDVTLEHIKEYTLVQNELKDISIVTFPIPSDVPSDNVDVHGLKAVFENTEKPCNLLFNTYEGVKYIFELAQAISGSVDNLKENPVLFAIMDATTPFSFKISDLEALLYACRYNQPLQVAHAPLAGATAPITIGGHIIVAAAEVLAMLVMSQLISPGTPVIANSMMIRLDMKANIHVNSIIDRLAAAACVQFYKEVFNIPTATNFESNGPAMDIQSGFERAVGAQLIALAGCDILGGPGALKGGLASSPIQSIIDDSLICELRKSFSGIRIDDDTIAWDDIVSVEHGGNFLSTKHTAKRCRDYFFTDLFSVQTMDEWIDKGKKDIREHAIEKYHEIKKNFQPRELSDTIKKDLNRIVSKADEAAAK